MVKHRLVLSPRVQKPKNPKSKWLRVRKVLAFELLGFQSFGFLAKVCFRFVESPRGVSSFVSILEYLFTTTASFVQLDPGSSIVDLSSAGQFVPSILDAHNLINA